MSHLSVMGVRQLLALSTQATLANPKFETRETMAKLRNELHDAAITMAPALSRSWLKMHELLGAIWKHIDNHADVGDCSDGCACIPNQCMEMVELFGDRIKKAVQP